MAEKIAGPVPVAGGTGRYRPLFKRVRYGKRGVRSPQYAADHVSPPCPDTRQLTAAAIIKLQEQGGLKVTDPVSLRIPGAPAIPAGRLTG